MIPPALSNDTGSVAEVLPLLDGDGARVWTVVLKQRYLLGPSGLQPVKGAKVHRVDLPWDSESPAGSTRYPADTCPFKPGTDVVVAADAIAPGERPVRELNVAVRVGPVSKQIRVLGTRVWYASLGSLALTPPQPFTRQPIRWEFAFGGLDASDPKRAVQEPRNPLGRGLAVRKEALLDQPAPHLEDPAYPLRGLDSRPPPAGLGALGPQFLDRLRFAGTMDKAWQESRAPLPPADFDERFFQVAIPELVCRPHLVGGEVVECHGLHADGPLAFRLPRRSLGCRAWAGQAWVDVRPLLDTVLLEPNASEVELTWRARFGAGVPPPTRIQIFEKEAIA